MLRLAVFSLLAVACSPSKTSSTGPIGPSAPKSWLVGDNGLMVSMNPVGEVRQRTHLTDAALNGLTSVDQYTAWTVGDQGAIFYTTDSGAHWLTQSSGTTASLSAVSFSNAQHGVVAGAAGTLLETDDGGAHWQLVGVGPVSTETRAYRAVVLSSSTGNGVAVGDAGLVSWTTDGGRTWVPHASSGALALTGVDLNADDVAVAVGRGGTAFRIDQDNAQPLAWSQISARDLFAVRFLRDGDHLVAVGAQGTIVQAQLSTGIAALASSASSDDLYAVASCGGVQAHGDQASIATVMAAGANGTIIVQSPASGAFEILSSHATSAIRSLGELSGD